MATEINPPVIGLDLSLTGTGWATYHPITEEIRFGTIAVRGKSGIERIAEIVRRLMIQIRELPSALIPVVIIEGFAFGRPHQAHQLGELHGAVKLELYRHRMRVLMVPPPRVKKFVTGSGASKKSTILREVWKRWRLDAEDDNQADAITLLQMGLCVAGVREPQTESQRQILAAIMKPSGQGGKGE